MANKVVTPAATVNSQIDNNALNPEKLVPAQVARDKRIVHITLEIEGNVTITPDIIYDMLDTQFPVVASNKTVQSRGTYIFNIGPA